VAAIAKHPAFRGWAGRSQDGGEGPCRVYELVSGGKPEQGAHAGALF
jgi:hypothetical protein